MWRVLGAVRTEFGKFGEALAKAQKKLQEASNTIDEARGKSTTITRRLKDVEALPEDEARALLGTPSLFDADDPGLGRRQVAASDMFTALQRWRQQRILRTQAIPEGLWRDSLESLPFLAIYNDTELARLRDKVVLFLNAKSIVGARGHHVTPRQRVVIALQACVLVLNLDLVYYDGWENVIVYPDEFVPGWEWEDEAGVVHTQRRAARRRGDGRADRSSCRGPTSRRARTGTRPG